MQLLFGTLSMVMIGVRYQNDNRAKFLMAGSPGIKLGMWVAFNVMPFFLPNNGGTGCLVGISPECVV